MSDEKNLIIDWLKQRQRGQKSTGKAAFLAHWDLIKSALNEGWTQYDIWSVLYEREAITVGYSWFLRMVGKQFAREQRQPKHSPPPAPVSIPPTTEENAIAWREKVEQRKAAQVAESVEKSARQPVIAIPKPPIDLNSGNLPDNYEEIVQASPIIRSRFKNMQKTGAEAEYYFLNNYKEIEQFASSSIEDARLLGDGYDFQLTSAHSLYLAEIKGIRHNTGHIRMTKNEFECAKEFKNEYALVIIHSMDILPEMVTVFNPINVIEFEQHMMKSEQIYFQSTISNWK